MTVKTVGRKALLKYSTVSAGGILLFTTVGLLFFEQGIGGQGITIRRIMRIYSNEISDNTTFIVIQVLVLLTGIWGLGGHVGQSIISKGRNRLLVGGLSILILWLVLFLGSAVTAGIENSIKYGPEGFSSAFTGWLIYGLIPFFGFGILNGLLLGFPLGQEIKREGVKLNAPQQNV
jgi:hypothetical protein